MTPHISLLKNALLQEQSNGRYRLLAAEDPSVPVSNIEFNNRKAARNWGRSRGILIADSDLDGIAFHGDN